MTRPSPREIESRLDSLTAADPDPDSGLVVEINKTLVMGRDRAEKEGRDILRPADVPQGDAVHVPRNPRRPL